MQSFQFATSLILFWLRGSLSVDQSVVALRFPNSWLGIPTGTYQEAIPIKNISSVKRGTYLSIPQLLIGGFLIWLGGSDLLRGRISVPIVGVLLLGVLLVLNCYKVALNIEKSGIWITIPFAGFEAKKASQILQVLTQAIYRDADKTDLSRYFDPKQPPSA